MSIIVVSWGSDGAGFQAETLYDPDTETFFDWNGQLEKYVKRETEQS